MAMLQLGGTLSNASVRITPRISLWVTAQHFLNASSVAPIPDTVVNTVEKEKLGKDQNEIRYRQEKVIGKQTLVTAAFKNLLESSENDNLVSNINQFNGKNSSINMKIHLASNVNQLLDTVKDPKFTQQNASAVVYVLCNWISMKKLTMDNIKNDPRYMKVCKILGIEKQSSNLLNVKNLYSSETYKSSIFHLVQTENVNKQIDNMNTYEMISVLLTLANKQKRAASTLKLLAYKISNADDKLNIKQLADILYSVAILNFYDEILMKKTCQDLLTLISKNKGTAVIGSILTSLGILRYRDEPLLDLLSSWCVDNKKIIRPQEISSLLMTLAILGYTPNNFSEIIESIVMPLKESDMCQSSEWLDIVWSLTIMNKSTSQHYESVLNNGFLNRIFDTTDAIVTRVVKLLNVNAAAHLTMPDYKGPFISSNSSLLSTTTTRSKDKIELSNSIISTLKILLPSDSTYLNVNTNTEMGFLLDAEFCVDNNCTPIPLNSNSEQDKKVFRIAVYTCSYHEFCRNKNEIIGPITFYSKLLELKGYKVLLVPYSKVKIKDKLVIRVKYIKDDIKKLLQKVTTQ